MKKTTRTFAEVEEISRCLPKELKMARAFLAPAYIAVTCKTADQLSKRFGLSVDAAEIRFGQLIELAKEGHLPIGAMEIHSHSKEGRS